jgi:hypothetical protein
LTAPLSFDEAIASASTELGFPTWYISNVRPLVRDPEGRWPRCCGGGCEPCSQTLVRVAQRALVLMGTPRVSPLPD